MDRNNTEAESNGSDFVGFSDSNTSTSAKILSHDPKQSLSWAYASVIDERHTNGTVTDPNHEHHTSVRVKEERHTPAMVKEERHTSARVKEERHASARLKRGRYTSTMAKEERHTSARLKEERHTPAMVKEERITPAWFINENQPERDINESQPTWFIGEHQQLSRSSSTSYLSVDPPSSRSTSYLSNTRYLTPTRSQSPSHYCQKCDKFYHHTIGCGHTVMGREDMKMSLSQNRQNNKENPDPLAISINKIGNNSTVYVGNSNGVNERMCFQKSDTDTHNDMSAKPSKEPSTKPKQRPRFERPQTSTDYTHQDSVVNQERSSFSRQSIEYSRKGGVSHVHVRKQLDLQRCSITDICQLPDGKFVITDTNNKSMKLLNASYCLVSSIDTKALPQYLCHIQGDQVAVTLNDWSIHFEWVGDSYQSGRPVNQNCRTICPGHVCMGISHYAGKLFVTDGGQSVYIFNLNGARMQVLNNGLFLKEIFSRTRKVTVSQEDGTLYVTDYSNGLITIAKRDMTNPHTYRFDYIENAMGVCLDTADKIYLAGYNSHNVVILGRRGKPVQKINLMHHGIQFPQALCVDINQSRLLVSSSECDTLSVIDLE